jgi:hypothetical protein
MRKFLAVSVVALFAAGPVLAQPVSTQYVSGPQPMHAPKGGWPKPVDHGPFTAQANAAYAGGGEILEGQPGGPPPRPMPMPAGQIPPNAVPQ